MKSKSLESVASQISQLSLNSTAATSKSSVNPTEVSDAANAGVDIDKKIRALKKKIRLAEGQLQKVSPKDMKPEQLEKLKKLEGWHDELKILESENTTKLSAS
ncbi:Partner of Y14 and mago [Bienertia sinuspersici]